MYESMLFLAWGVGLFAAVATLVLNNRLVIFNAAAMSTLTIMLTDLLPTKKSDHYKILDCGMKSFPIEALSHAPLTAMMKIVAEHRINPDEVTEIKVDRRSLPKGPRYQEVGHEIRQVIDIDISRFVIEYRAQILEDNQGNRFVATFPEGVNRPVQYGLNLKANAVYMFQHQLIPYDRVRDHFQD